MCVPRRKGNIVTAAAVVIGKKKSSRPRRVYRERSERKVSQTFICTEKKERKISRDKKFPSQIADCVSSKAKGQVLGATRSSV